MADKGRMVPALVEFLAEITGEPASTLNQIARRTREAGYLSQAGHGRAGAKATSRDAATILLVSMATNTAIHAGAVVEALSALKRQTGEFTLEYLGYESPEKLAGVDVEATNPIGAVAGIIDALRRRDENFKAITFVQITTRGDPHVTICWANDDDMHGWHFSAPEKSEALGRYRRVAHRSGTASPGAKMRRIVRAEGWILEYLADWLEGRETD